MKILLKNAEIITLNNSDEVIKNGCIGIEGNNISYVGENRPELEKNYDKVIDCTGKAVMPGFVNAHNHAAMVMFRNYADDMKLMDWLFNKIFPLEDKLDSSSVYWASQLAILEMIKSGTTAFTDMYFFTEDTIKAVEESGIRAVISRGLQGDTSEGLDLRLKENIELYNKYSNSFDGRLSIMFGPHSVYTCTEGYLRKISDKAKELNIPIQVHLSETKDEVKNCIDKYGVSPVKLLERVGMLSPSALAAHCVIVDDEDINILAENGVSVAHNPGSNLKLASGIAPVAKMLKRGINVCLGTDGASSNNNLDMLEEVRLASYLQKVYVDDPTVLPVDQVLKMATVNGARALSLKETGTIEEGKKADIIIFNTEKSYYYPKYNTKSAIVYSGNSSDIETVIINGKLVMENNLVSTIDEERVFYEVQRCAEKIIK